MSLLNKSQTNSLLGYPAEARLLIINADDFGMCHAVNEASLRAFKEGLASSCTLMTPCPWALHALKLLQDSPEIPFGVHLTSVSEQPYYRWGPLTCRQEIPSLVDEVGYFYSEARIDEFLGQVNLAELEREYRAQIELVLETGLQPTHLDSHCGIHTRREQIFEMTVGLAWEYGLALRVSGQSFIEKLQQQGYPTNDHALMDSYELQIANKSARYAQMLRALPAGLTEWAVHPGLGNGELRALMPSWQVRQSDFDFFMSPEARTIVEEEGIIILDYRMLQTLWRSVK
jgi:chitin disaccharide deacetylase